MSEDRHPTNTDVMLPTREEIEAAFIEEERRLRDTVPPPSLHAILAEAQGLEVEVECPGCDGRGRVHPKLAARIKLAMPAIPEERDTETRMASVEDIRTASTQK